ncbi:humanin-like protein [Chionomys nivalis]|uniref:humanin-like protein n=1 Tax=Chionomys nivalis TaxID=269649 RepID=UPI00259967B7|nr:humanin-like protein [Chionomys nivalis]
MAPRGFNCLLLLISEIDLPVKRRGYHNKTRRPYGALINWLNYPTNYSNGLNKREISQ